MISCKECRELLPILLDGGLDKNQRFDLEEHLKACQTCHAEVARVATVISHLRYAAHWQPATPPPPVISPPSHSLVSWFQLRQRWLLPFALTILFSLSWAAYQALWSPPEAGYFGCHNINGDFLIELKTPEPEPVRLQVWDNQGRLAADFWVKPQPSVLYRWRLSELLKQSLKVGEEYRVRATRLHSGFWGEVRMTPNPPE